MIELEDGQIENVCPTTFFNVQQLAAQYIAFDAPPPGAVTKHYSKYVRDLVFDLYRRNEL